MTTISDERLAEMLAEVEIEFDNALLDAEADQNPQLAVDPVGEFDLIELRSILSELLTLRAQGGVRVKPLEWEQIGDNHWRADTAFGPWEVCAQPMFGKSWRTFSPTGWKTYHGDDPEELKRLSEQELSKRILSSLEASPAPVGGEMARRFIKRYREIWPGAGWPSLSDATDLLTAALAAKGGQ